MIDCRKDRGFLFQRMGKALGCPCFGGGNICPATPKKREWLQNQ